MKKDRIKLWLIVITIVCCLPLLSACNQEENAPADTGTASVSNTQAETQTGNTEGGAEPENGGTEGRVFNDREFGEVTIYGTDFQRIITTTPSLTINAIMAGAGEKIVALDKTTSKNAWILEKLPYLQDAGIVDNNVESYLNVEPDLCIIGPGRLEQAGIEALDEIGIAYISRVPITEGTNVLQRIKENQSYYTEVIGGEAVEYGKMYAEEFDRIYNLISERTAALEEGEKPRAIQIRSADPLQVMSNGEDSCANIWITLGGGVNCSADGSVLNESGASQVEVSVEQIIAWDPEVIFAYDAAVADAILADEAFADISAVKNGKVITTPMGLMSWGHNGGEELLMMIFAAKVLQPELFADMDFETEMREFYRTFFGFEITEADIERIFNTELSLEEYVAATFSR